MIDCKFKQKEGDGYICIHPTQIPVDASIIPEDDCKSCFLRDKAPIKEIEEDLKADLEAIHQFFIANEKQKGSHALAKMLTEKENKFYTVSDTKEIYYYKDGIYEPDGERIILEKIQRILEDKNSNFVVNEVMGHIKRSTLINREKFTAPENLICLDNGILDIETMMIHEHTESIIFLNKIPVNYDSTIEFKAGKQFINEILEDEENINIMQEFIGYLLYKKHPFHKALMMVGSGANGKCQKGDDKVLMSNGEWKEIKDIKIGDEIISPQIDGSYKFCKIINTHNRFEEDVYEVREKTRKNRLLYTCAGNHIIPIIRTWTKRTSKDDSTPRLKKRKLFEYDAHHISKLENSKSRICSFSTTAIDYKQKDAEINPYCLGAWLGDGHFVNTSLSITTKDKEVIEEFDSNEFIKSHKKKNNLATSYRLSVKGNFAKQLINLKLKGKTSINKFIPKECLLSSINYRKDLLAGLIDTDGFVQKETSAIYYSTISKHLSEDIKNLVFSLGGYATIHKKISKCQNGFIGNYFELSIQFKDRKIIPLKIPFKKNRLKERRIEPRHIAIECVKTKPQQVYGIEIEGNSKWYITNNWVVTHNSTLINLIKTFLGFKNCTSIPLQRLDTDKFATSQMYGKLANLFADLPPRGLKETSIFKMLTGEDFIPAQRKFRDEFQFVNYAKQIFSANQVPKSMDDSDAFFRRWLPITFGKQFLEGKADVDMLKKITTPEELSGLLNWAIAGLKRLLKNKKFSSSKSIANVREEYIRMSDSVGAFIMDCVDASPDEYVIKKDLYVEYTAYCRDRNYPIVSEIVFHKEILKQLRVEDFRATDPNGNRIYTWKGIKLRTQEEKQEDIEEIKID